LKIVTIVGARPQFIKAAAISREVAFRDGVQEVIVHTGQHFDKNMSDVFFEEMKIPKPNYLLEINSLTHGAMTGRMLEAIEKVLQAEQPDWVLVYGDTNSTLAGALAASKLQIKVAHGEAGLRSFNMKMPEEVNRILTDRISNILFCPTDTAIENLSAEGFANFDCKIVKCGDVMEDAALFYNKLADEHSNILQRLGLDTNNFVLCTIHRAENTDDEACLRGIVNAVNILNETTPVVLPLHPRTRKKMEGLDLTTSATVIEPVGYFDMIHLIKGAKLIMTDSGGLQKEAFFFDKFCVTMREQTEWRELVDFGYNRLTGSNSESILDAAHYFMKALFQKKHDFYGGGTASAAIIDHLLSA
jgi:UDP-GlcNAc3NAcA epimerase